MTAICQVAGFSSKKGASAKVTGTAKKRASPWSRANDGDDVEDEDAEEQEDEADMCFDDGFDQLQAYREGLEEAEIQKFIAQDSSSSSSDEEGDGKGCMEEGDEVRFMDTNLYSMNAALFNA